jgi:Fic family protein
MSFIHNLSDWPQFQWSSELLAQPLAAVRHKQGRHLGRMETLGFELRAEANLVALTQDVVKSSAIEGEILSRDEVRSSLARRLGLNVAGLPEPSREVEGIVEMMLDATGRCLEPLSAERLYGWHAALFPTGRSGMYPITVGAWRTDKRGPMEVVSGPIGNERVHFQAPAADRLDKEMAHFLEWFDAPGDLDAVLQAGVAHFWFVSIHPFEDGNGRIARAIADMALARGDGCGQRFYSMSNAIESNRKEYYLRLEAAQRGSLDISSWLSWFLGCLDRALDVAGTMLNSVLYKARLWQELNKHAVSERQRTVVNRMLDDWKGYLNTSKYAKLAKCSTDTALRDIRDLLNWGVLVQNPGGGRSTSYRLATLDELPC